MRVGALGPVIASVAGRDIGLGGPKQRLVLALLIHRRGRTVSSESLADGLWGDDQPDNARKTLQVYISNLRKALGEGADHLESGAGGYRLEGIGTDVDDFERLVAEADELATTAPAEAAHLLDEALLLWRGTPYADCDSIQLRSEITRLEELRLAAVERRLELDLDLGRHVSALAELGTLATDYPFRERIHGLLMLALYRSGRQAEALRTFAKLRTSLVDELGIEPSPELQRLEQRILDQDPQLDPPAESTVDMQRTVLLFTDLVASTALWDVDQEAMAKALESHDRILDKSVTVAGGRVWKHTGDGVLAVMPDVDAAVAAAHRAQDELRRDERLKVRMAIHVGDAHRRGDDFFGPGLNLCARMLASAHGGQTLLSDAAVSELAVEGGTVDLGEHRFRGAGVPIRVYQLDGGPTSFPGLSLESPALAIERIGFGRNIRGFELRERIGNGPMGEVYRAFQASMSREVALKVVDASVATDPEFVRRFESDARMVTQLEHPHIVPIHDSWRDPEGAYLVMRFMRGGSLARALRSGTWKPAPALRLLEQVGAALSYAHRRGVLHLDLHPGNVLMDEDGNAYLTDFAIAGATAGVATEGPTGHVAPEVRRGQLPTAAGDLYSLAALAAGLLGVSRESTSSPVADVLDRAMSVEPERRYERVDDLLRALRQALGADVVVTEPALAERPHDVRNPYKGLRAFQERDADDFFGRDELVERLLDAVGSERLVAIVGPSGCGKSSVVKAGLIPRVRSGAVESSGSWHVTEMFPGAYPFEELEEALLRVAVQRPPDLLDVLEGDSRGLLRVAKEILPDGDAELLLIIDQFEELFSLTTAEDTRRAFLEALATAVSEPDSRVRVLLTMRADFLDRPLAYTGFGELLERAVIPVAVPSEDGLTLAIVRPARRVGLDIQPGLVGQMVRDVADQPGALPLMQHALTELFMRSDTRLTIADYEASGGVLGALGARAEELYLGLTPGARPVARQLLLRLVNVDDDTSDIRRRAKRTELRQLDMDPKALEEVLQAFGSFRLLTFDQDQASRTPTVEVAHEALLREWPRLREWIDEESEGLHQRRRLIAAVQEWHSSDRDPAYLLAGGRLEHFEEWAGATDLSLTIPESEYLAVSRSDEDRRKRRRTRARALVGAVLAAAAAVAIVFAIIARGNEELARARELAASAIAVLDQDPELSVLLALEASSVAEPPLEAVRALHEAVQNLRLTDAVAILAPGEDMIIRTEGYTSFSTEPGRLFTSADGATIVEWQVAADGSLDQVDSWTIDGSPLDQIDVASSRDRSVVGALGSDGRAVFWNRRGVTQFSVRPGIPRPLSLSADGSRALIGTASTATSSALLSVVDTRSSDGTILGDIEVKPVPVDIDLTPDGSAIVVTQFNPGGTYVIEITDNGLVRRDLVPFGIQSTQSDVHPDGTQVASTGQGGWLFLSDHDAGTVQRFHAHDSAARAVRYSADGSLVATGGDDGTVRIFDSATGREVMTLFGQGSPPKYMAFTSDGRSLITAGQDHVLRVWDLTVAPGAELGWVDLEGFGAVSLTREGDVTVVLTRAGRAPGPAYLIDVSAMSFDAAIEEQWGKSAAISQDGTRIATQGPGGDSPGLFATRDVVIRNGAGDSLQPLQGICEAITEGTTAVIHDEERFEASCADAYDDRFSKPTNGMVFSPDRAHIAVSGRAISISNVETGSLEAAAIGFAEGDLPPRKDHMAIGFTPDGSRLVVAVSTGGPSEVLVLDAATLGVERRFPVSGNWGGVGRLHPAGVFAVVPSAPGTIDLVNLEEGTVELHTVHDSAVTAVEFSGDGSQLITAGASGEIKIWDTSTMTLQLSIPYAIGGIQGLTAVGDQIIVVDNAGTMARLTTDTDELIAIGSSRVTRSLTDEECRIYLHTDGCRA